MMHDRKCKVVLRKKVTITFHHYVDAENKACMAALNQHMFGVFQSRFQTISTSMIALFSSIGLIKQCHIEVVALSIASMMAPIVNNLQLY